MKPPKKKFKIRRDFCGVCMSWNVMPPDEEACAFHIVEGRGRCSAEKPAEHLQYEAWPITKPKDLGCENFDLKELRKP